MDFYLNHNWSYDSIPEESKAALAASEAKRLAENQIISGYNFQPERMDEKKIELNKERLRRICG